MRVDGRPNNSKKPGAAFLNSSSDVWMVDENAKTFSCANVSVDSRRGARLFKRNQSSHHMSYTRTCVMSSQRIAKFVFFEIRIA